jgi:murein DD-endopeptidase MepM/ murein hydrolase activator NlpD
MKRKARSVLASACIFTTALLASLTLYAQSVGADGIAFRPPFDGTYRVTAYFDHDEPSYAGGADGYNWIYTGERVPSSYANKTGELHPHDGHDGWDWSMGIGVDILAVAAGTVEVSENMGGYGQTIIINHGNGYYSMYSHLSQRLVFQGDSVTSGQHIAESGDSGNVSAHLHFGVRYGGYANTTYAVDPFGWRGSIRDPLFDYNGKVSTCLWRSRNEDSISCADTIVEDAGAGSGAFPLANWQVGNRGNGYHTFYRSNTSSQYENHTWLTSAISNPLRSGPSKLYVFIPEDPDGDGGLAMSQQASYHIRTSSGWQSTGPVNQSANVNTWVPLGTYTLAGHSEAGMWGYTGESVGTRWVMADAFKWRQYQTYLPTILNNYPLCTSAYGQIIANGDFSTGDATGWSISRTNGSEPIVQVYGGNNYGAWIGRYHYNQDNLSQLTCPATPVDYASFSFWWWMSTEETSTTADYDFLYVRIRDANGNLLQTLKTITNRRLPETWQSVIFDLRAYAGQSIKISFEAVTDGTLATNFWLDTVSFYVADW